MSWINTINYREAGKRLKRLYDKVKGPDNNVDNVLKVHSLRPHSLTAHMTMYKAVLHNQNNTLPKWYLEAIGVYVSKLNKCSYCVDHHTAGLTKLIGEVKAEKCVDSMDSEEFGTFFLEQHMYGLEYAKALTVQLVKVAEADIQRLRAVGFSDGEILEINQVTSYFNYVNRVVVGLGVDTKGDILGLSPNDSSDASNWSHS